MRKPKASNYHIWQTQVQTQLGQIISETAVVEITILLIIMETFSEIIMSQLEDLYMAVSNFKLGILINLLSLKKNGPRANTQITHQMGAEEMATYTVITEVYTQTSLLLSTNKHTKISFESVILRLENQPMNIFKGVTVD